MAQPDLDDAPPERTLESIHRDVDFALKFRLELIKHLMTIAAAVFAFTISFRPPSGAPQTMWLMGLGWIALGISMAGGLVHMRGWDRYYMTYRDYDWDRSLHDSPARRREIGRQRRRIINWWRETAMWIQYVTFVVGILAIGVFAWKNISQGTAS